MYYVNERWLGGLLTNFATIQRSLGRLRDLEAMATDGRFDTLSKKEIARNEKERRKLAKNLDGIRGMSRLPDAVFIVDTNCDPDEVDFVIPGNDDALRAIRLFASRIADAAIAGRDLKQSMDVEAVREAAGGSAEGGSAGADDRRPARAPRRAREAAPASA
jgi:small subunit ribosomal protein S2